MMNEDQILPNDDKQNESSSVVEQSQDDCEHCGIRPLQPISATVGQILDDLRLIAKRHPRCKEWYGDGGQGAPCEAVFFKDDVIVLLMMDEFGCKHLSVNQIISELAPYDPDMPVVFTYDYWYYQFVKQDGHFISYREDYSSCYYAYQATDVRVPTKEQIKANDAQQYVDLGLSVKWATYNLGASSMLEYGDYYAWGEIAPKKYYDEKKYRFGKNPPYKKYQSFRNVEVRHLFRPNETKQVGDNLLRLLPEDDAASVILGGRWRIPTPEEFQELLDQCSWTWVGIQSCTGYIVQSKKNGYRDRWIFLPAAGMKCEDGKVFYKQYGGTYWTSSIPKDSLFSAEVLSFPYTQDTGTWNRDIWLCKMGKASRYLGRPIRPVLSE